MNAYDIIKKPILSEKCYAGIETKKYAFIVDKKANKLQVRRAVEEIFGDGIKVERVNIVNCRGKLKRQGRTQGYTSSFKKAYVQLAKSSKPIEFFESLGL